MRLRLVHTLSLMLIAAVLLAVLGIGLATAWNLRNGFSDYIAARDAERLEQFAQLVAQAVDEAGGIQALPAGQLDLFFLLGQLGQRGSQGLERRPLGPPPEPRFSPGDAPRFAPGRRPGPDRDQAPDWDSRRGPPPPLPGPPGMAGGPPPDGPDPFGERICVVALNGQLLAGRLVAATLRGAIERPVIVRGEPIAYVRLRPPAGIADAVDARFLRSQYLGILGVSVVLLLIAVMSAGLTARYWVRPLIAVQLATARLARGELAVRVGRRGGWASRTDEIGDVVRNVDAMAESLQRIESARRRWIADMSHELRTPLTVLRGEIEALVDGVRPLRTEAIVSLRAEVVRLGALIEDLHLLAIADLQGLPCHVVDTDAVEIVRAAGQRFASLFQRAGLDLRLPLPQTRACRYAGIPRASSSSWANFWKTACATPTRPARFASTCR